MAKKVSLTFVLILSAVAFMVNPSFAQKSKEAWIDSVFQTLNTEEKIGQLIMVRVPSNSEEDQENLIDKIRSYRIGGAIIMKGGPVSHARFVNKIQETARVPMFFGLEATTGVGQAIDSILTFSHPLVLSALKNDSVIYSVGEEIAAEMKSLGFQINFTPQVNFEYRSEVYPGTLMHYSDNTYRVQRKSALFVSALQQNGVIACVQHQPQGRFPQGTNKVLYAGKPDDALFAPYQHLISNGLSAIRTTNLPFFYLENNQELPRKISQAFINEQVKHSVAFNGLTFIDASSLHQDADEAHNGETEVLAFQVGNDIIIEPKNISAMVRILKKSLKKNEPLQQHLDATVKKILAAKYDAGLASWQPVNTENILHRLNSLPARLLQKQIVEKSITLIENDNNVLPVQSLENKRFASFVIGKEKDNEFTHTLSKYAPFDHYAVKNPEDTTLIDLDIINKYDYVVIALYPGATSFLPAFRSFIGKIKPKQKIICHFGDPLQFNLLSKLNVAIAAYADTPLTENTAAQMIFGAMTFDGCRKKPVWTARPSTRSRTLYNKLSIQVQHPAPTCS